MSSCETSSRTTQSTAQTGALEEPVALLEHLCAGEPGTVIFVACSSEEHIGLVGGEAPFDIVHCNTLVDAEPSTATQASSVAGKQIAVVDIGLDEPTFSLQMGQALRVFPDHLIVFTRATSVADTLFFSFGFRKLNVLHSDSVDAKSRWYEFRLSHYKQVPDWLNARNWANPERFELDDESDIYIDPDGSDEEE